jgi:hypothetical protein
MGGKICTKIRVQNRRVGVDETGKTSGGKDATTILGIKNTAIMLNVANKSIISCYTEDFTLEIKNIQVWVEWEALRMKR